MSSKRVQWDVNIAYSAEKKYVVYAESQAEAELEAEDKFFLEVGPTVLNTKTLCIDHVTAEETAG